MNNQLRQDRRKIILFIGIILICIAIAAALKIPRWKITREVRTYAEELPVRMEYAVPEQLSTRDEKLTALLNLVRWEEETRTAIDTAFDQDETVLDEEETEEEPWILDSRDVFYEYARKKQWKSMRLTLQERAEQAIEELFEKAGEIPGTSRGEVKQSLQKGRFKTVCEIMDLAGEGNYHLAYTKACKGTLTDGGGLYRALAFGLYPDEMKKECEAELQEDLKNHGDMVYVLDADVLWLEDISKQYGIRIDGLAEARKKVNQMKVKERQKSSASSSGKSSSYGTSSSKKSTSSNSYRPSSSSRDFDQYDIEAYYEDNRDEYDDYDDAYEGFMDDDDAWDDY
ncbi:MAG: hypothetical protein II627_06915 [Lachnospiraceae bacterium]|nr:hypothetical protein [Lachnospiraceae bacterium]